MQHATIAGARAGASRAGSLRATSLTLALAAVAVIGGGTAVLVTTAGSSGAGDTPQNAHPVRGWNAPAVQAPVRVYSAPDRCWGAQSRLPRPHPSRSGIRTVKLL